MHMYQPGGLVIAYGAQTFTQNTAVINGGAIYNQGASLSFNGPLCAQGEFALTAGMLHERRAAQMCVRLSRCDIPEEWHSHACTPAAPCFPPRQCCPERVIPAE